MRSLDESVAGFERALGDVRDSLGGLTERRAADDGASARRDAQLAAALGEVCPEGTRRRRVASGGLIVTAQRGAAVFLRRRSASGARRMASRVRMCLI